MFCRVFLCSTWNISAAWFQGFTHIAEAAAVSHLFPLFSLHGLFLWKSPFPACSCANCSTWNNASVFYNSKGRFSTCNRTQRCFSRFCFGGKLSSMFHMEHYADRSAFLCFVVFVLSSLYSRTYRNQLCPDSTSLSYPIRKYALSCAAHFFLASHRTLCSFFLLVCHSAFR